MNRKSGGRGVAAAVLIASATIAIASQARPSERVFVFIGNTRNGRGDGAPGDTYEESRKYNMQQCEFWSDGDAKGQCRELGVCRKSGSAGMVSGESSTGFYINTVCGAANYNAAYSALMSDCTAHATKCKVTGVWSTSF